MKNFRDYSVSKKLYLIVGAMAILITIELVTLWFAIDTLSAVRATVSAEGLYSKAQKDGIYQLEKYCRTYDEKDYAAYLQFMQVPLGDRKTRVELMKPNPDIEIARQGFTQGRVHKDDIDGVIKLLQRFHANYHISKAITAWTKGDSLISFLTPLGDSIHSEIKSGTPSKQRLDVLLERIENVNRDLTLLEDDFSYTLGEGSRWLENFILKLLFGVALTVEITGLIMTILVSRSIRRGLNEIVNTTDKISKGDLTARATVFAGDEIGKVATAVNEMTNQLVTSNKELTQYAYVASHDLQEPLRTITNYTALFKDEYKDQLDERGNKYLNTIENASQRMRLLIKDILAYSEIGVGNKKEIQDLNQMLAGILSDLSAMIEANNVLITHSELPSIAVYPEIRSLFQNLISNAIKFRKPPVQCQVNIGAERKGNDWIFSVKDNGIGIDPVYHEKIFTIFQKLHSKKDYPGSGIGLAQCKKIAELHGGRIWLESKAGEGSTFYFSIPA